MFSTSSIWDYSTGYNLTVEEQSNMAAVVGGDLYVHLVNGMTRPQDRADEILMYYKK